MKSFFVILLLTTACAKTTTQAPVSADKALTSIWQSLGPNWSMDLTAFDDNQIFQMVTTYGSGGTCTSQAHVTGFYDQEDQDDNSGQLTISGSVATDTESGMAPCSQFDGTWSYYHLTDAILMCKTGFSCVELK